MSSETDTPTSQYSQRLPRRYLLIWGGLVILCASALAVDAYRATDARLDSASRHYAATLERRLITQSAALEALAAWLETGAAVRPDALLERLRPLNPAIADARLERDGPTAGPAELEPAREGYRLARGTRAGRLVLEIDRTALLPELPADLGVRLWLGDLLWSELGPPPLQHVLLPELSAERRVQALPIPLLLRFSYVMRWSDFGVGRALLLVTTASLSLPILLVFGRVRERARRARRQATLRLYRLANYDSLTGLPNRNLLRDRLSHGLEVARRRGTGLGLFFLDLDGFKAVNDSAGHEAGDQLLVMVAERLRAAVRAQDTVARLSGDEFVLILEDINDHGDAERVLQELKTAFDAPFGIGDFAFLVTASVGFALYPDNGEDPAALLRHADQNMYACKYPEWAPPVRRGEPIRLSGHPTSAAG